MNYKPSIWRILGAAAAAFIVVGFFMGIRKEMANSKPIAAWLLPGVRSPSGAGRVLLLPTRIRFMTNKKL